MSTTTACRRCGRAISRPPRQRRYCTAACRHRARREQVRQRVADHRARHAGRRVKSFLAIPPHELAVPEPGWQSEPLRGCAGLTSLFFPPKGSARRTSVTTDAICAVCVVRESCLTWALTEADAVYGRIARTSPGDRRHYRHKYGLRAPTISSVELILGPMEAARKFRRERQSELLGGNSVAE